MQCGSYNVNGKKPPAGLKLEDWLQLLDDKWTSHSGDHKGCDILAVGFQEIVSLSAGNVIVGGYM